MKFRQNIPNVVTSLNLVCGMLSIWSASKYDGTNGTEYNLLFASFFIGLAAVLDLLDGMVARLLKVHSEMGKQLDSLADMVSFGIAPAFIFYYMVHRINFLWDYEALNEIGMRDVSEKMYQQMMSETMAEMPSYSSELALGLSVLIGVFSALRLAKFNIDTRQTDSFIGVPTPANAMLIASFPLILKYHGDTWTEIFFHPWFICAFPVVASLLLVSEIPLLSLKFKNLGWKGNEFRWSLLALSAVLVIYLRFASAPFIFAAYIILSVIQNTVKPKQAS